MCTNDQCDNANCMCDPCECTPEMRCECCTRTEQRIMKIKELDENAPCWTQANCAKTKDINVGEHEAKSDLGWNIIEDLHIHMKNAPMFYSKHYYPCMAKLQDQLKQGNPDLLDAFMVSTIFLIMNNHLRYKFA